MKAQCRKKRYMQGVAYIEKERRRGWVDKNPIEWGRTRSERRCQRCWKYNYEKGYPGYVPQKKLEAPAPESPNGTVNSRYYLRMGATLLDSLPLLG
jgi:hypothetical protein